MPFSDNARGALFMSASMAGFVFNDALIKLAADDLGLAQAVFLRGLFATAFVLVLARATGALAFRPRRADWGPLTLRTGAEVATTAAYLTALLHMPIANATAILQTAPLAVTMGAALVLAEPVGWRRWTAIGVGFAGVLIIVRPGAVGFDAYALLALLAVAFITVRDLATRRMTKGTPTLFASALTAAAITLFAGLATPFQGWTPVGPPALATLAAASMFLLVGYVTGVAAMRVGEISAVSPFRYTILVWAIVLGWIVFGDVPDLWMLIGSAVVIGAGLYTLWRERAARRSRPAAEAMTRPPAREGLAPEDRP